VSLATGYAAHVQGLLVRDAEVEGVRADVRIAGGRVQAIGPCLAVRPGEASLEASGGALLPGLHDHHLHLLAWAAALASVPCGPPAVRDERALAAALRAAPAQAGPGAAGRGAGVVGGVGYPESVARGVAGTRLDALAPGAAVRVLHRSGALWMLSSEACRRLGLDAGVDAPGVERAADGRANGRLFRLDAWLRERLGEETLPDLAPVGAALTRFGVSGVTDATPDLAPAALDALARAAGAGALPQRVVLLGAAAAGAGGFAVGPHKLVLDERALPPPATFAARLHEAHDTGRPVAVHCVTRAELVLALAAFEEAGVRAGDRIEHASVAPPELVGWIARLGLAVVTQPGFVRTRGDDYLREVDARDRPWLYRCAGFEAAGVALGAGSDAPFGAGDPWLAMQAAVDRRTLAGAALGVDEALSPERALALFTTPAEAPGGPPRRVAAGAPADLCLLDRPWARAREALSSDAVVATIARGRWLGPTPRPGPSPRR
jgi:predicted amidohydrolase YtcJ